MSTSSEQFPQGPKISNKYVKMLTIPLMLLVGCGNQVQEIPDQANCKKDLTHVSFETKGLIGNSSRSYQITQGQEYTITDSTVKRTPQDRIGRSHKYPSAEARHVIRICEINPGEGKAYIFTNFIHNKKNVYAPEVVQRDRVYVVNFEKPDIQPITNVQPYVNPE